MDLAAEDEGLAAEDEGVAIQDKGLGFQGNLSAEDGDLASIFFVADLNKKFDYFTIKIDGKIIKYTFSYNMSQLHFTKFVSNLRIFQEIIL